MPAALVGEGEGGAGQEGVAEGTGGKATSDGGRTVRSGLGAPGVDAADLERTSRE